MPVIPATWEVKIKDCGSSPAQEKKLARPYLKEQARHGGVYLVIPTAQEA
jgi:hypothetical protein